MANPWHLLKIKALERGSKLIGKELVGARLVGANLQGAKLRGALLARSDLSWANLSMTDFKGASFVRSRLIRANLTRAFFHRSELHGANLSYANMLEIDLSGANLTYANLTGSNLEGADLTHTVLEYSDLRYANLRGAQLWSTNLMGAKLTGANLAGATLYDTIFSKVNLSEVEGLNNCRHWGPSTLGHSTLAKSGNLPDIFLRGVGLPDNYIDYIPSLFGSSIAIQFYSCFISYSSKDEEFAKRLHDSLQGQGVRCWFAPEDMKGGRKIHHQIDEGIRLHDKLVLVLSEASMKSDWVQHEIKRTRKREKAEGRQMLFPISITPYDNIAQWELFDPATVTDLADEIRSYFIPDFSIWEDHDSYQLAFNRLLKDLQADEGEN